MKALFALIILFSSFAKAECGLNEDPPTVNGCNLNFVYLPTGSEWTRLFYNPSSSGLNNAGAMSANASVVMSANDALIGKVEANVPMLNGNSVIAGTDSTVWLDVVLHRSSEGANTIELIAYRYASGKLLLEDSVVTSSLGTTATTEFGIDYSYTSRGTVTANIRALGSSQVLAAMSVAQFGQTLPSFKLRRGTQPTGSGLLSASFTQNIIE